MGRRARTWQVSGTRALVVLPALALAVTGCAGRAGETSAASTLDPPDQNSTHAEPLDAVIDMLEVAQEYDRDGYDRELFEHWISQGDGCDSRDRVLLEEAVEPPEVAAGCTIVGGSWFSPYDDVQVTDPSQLDIDHMVPLAEAWDSGAGKWSAARREQFANDITDTETLIAVTASSNRSKGDQDPAEWKPPRHEYWCTYAESWIAVKVKWSLSADPAEVAGLREMLGTCT